MTPPPPPLPECPIAQAERPWPSGTPQAEAPPLGAAVPLAGSGVADRSAAASEPASDYRHRLRATPHGWPIRPAWCVWLEPAKQEGPAALWELRWQRATLAALASWQQLLPIRLVSDPASAQVLIQRRRPPLRNGRASHGRAQLQLLVVQRQQRWQLEPRVEVLLSPGQAEPAMQATALHELGHAFGLWGHSDQSGDALAASPGPRPVLELSRRDRATLRWLMQQPGLRQDLLPSTP